MPRRQLESSLEKRVVHEAEKLGIIPIKLANRSSSGWPDRLLILPDGKVLFLELKRFGEVPKPLQNYRIRQLRKLGHAAEWADNYDSAMGYILQEMGAAQRPG